jgi:hypothetical protein
MFFRLPVAPSPSLTSNEEGANPLSRGCESSGGCFEETFEMNRHAVVPSSRAYKIGKDRTYHEVFDCDQRTRCLGACTW